MGHHTYKTNRRDVIPIIGSLTLHDIHSLTETDSADRITIDGQNVKSSQLNDD